MIFRLLLLVVASGLIYGWFPPGYPAYCAKDMSTRAIPNLTDAQMLRVTSLRQIQAVIRHGARTPHKLYPCWRDYSVAWNNCNVTDLMIASSSYNSKKKPAPWLFRKVYDGSDNFLGGNCLTGQLILEGYQQENALGTLFSYAYLSSKLKLFETNVWESIDTANEIYLRSDDEERTLMSGQISTESIVPWHTGDYALDQIYPNYRVCPRLSSLEASIFAGEEWSTENSSTPLQRLNWDLDQIFGAGSWSWNYTKDCLMTTVCTDREIPDGDPSTGVVMNEAIFNATLTQCERIYAYKALFNDSQWSKLAIGNTAWHLRSNLEHAISGTSQLKFALFSAHDTTQIPLLAAILGSGWDGHWPGYASAITFELYIAAADNQSYLFRMVYNGEAQLVPGCSDTLCDVNVLLSKLAFGQESMPCSVQAQATATVTGDLKRTGASLATRDWIMIVVLSTLLGALIGAAAVVFGAMKYIQKIAVTGRAGVVFTPVNDEDHSHDVSHHAAHDDAEEVRSPMVAEHR